MRTIAPKFKTKFRNLRSGPFSTSCECDWNAIMDRMQWCVAFYSYAWMINEVEMGDSWRAWSEEAIHVKMKEPGRNLPNRKKKR